MLLFLLRDRQKSTEKHVFARLEGADMRAWSGRGRRAPARGSGGGATRRRPPASSGRPDMLSALNNPKALNPRPKHPKRGIRTLNRCTFEQPGGGSEP